MSDQSYTTAYAVDPSPEAVFAAINHVRGWWSQEIEGATDRLGAEFTYRLKDLHRCSVKITEFVPGRKVVWHVTDHYLKPVKDQNEWPGTDIVFEIHPEGDKTGLRFTHAGLVPTFECYDICSAGWSNYIDGSLRSLIETGTGRPNPKES